MSKLSKRVKQGKVDIDFDDCALLVNYDIEMVEMDDNGYVLGAVERRPEVRRIKIKTLSADKDLAQLATDIVDKCKYIHGSRVEEIEQLLIKLRKHTLNKPLPNNNENEQQETINKSKKEKKSQNYEQHDNIPTENQKNRKKSESIVSPSVQDLLPPAYMEELDDYLDMLYQVASKSEKGKEESLKLQEKGTGMILKLCRDVMNLEQLIQNSTVMGALTRVLQEEFKKSVDLTFNILRIFLAFSNFKEMHTLMSNYRIGVLTMKAIEFEMQRTKLRENEKKEREEEWNLELEHIKETNPDNYSKTLEKIRKQREKDSIKLKIMERKQDKLLFVGFYTLLNLAEDITVERKMVKKQLLPMLFNMLNRHNEDLLVLSGTFLKKLSIIDENKELMKEKNIVEHLLKFVPCSSQPLILVTLRLLFNLSYDKEIRDQMLKSGYVPRLINLLKTPSFRAKTLRLLYHLSVDDRCKSMFTYTDGIPILMGLVINFPQNFLARELAALMVNLSYNSRNTEQMIANKGLNLLMDRLSEKRDPLLLKIIRNISLWTFKQQEELENPEMQYRWRGLWSPHVKVLLEISQETDNHDILVELFGTLANLTIYDLPSSANWSKLVREYDLLNLFCKMLVPGMVMNDLMLELIMLLSSIAADPQACKLIGSSTLISQLHRLWQEKTDDSELVLQIMHCFHRLLSNEASREEVLYGTRCVVDALNMLNHPRAAVRAQATVICEIVLEYDRNEEGEPGQLGKEIIKKKFESYNKVWLSHSSPMLHQMDDPYMENLSDLSDVGGYSGKLMGRNAGGMGFNTFAHPEDDMIMQPNLGENRFYGDKELEWKGEIAYNESDAKLQHLLEPEQMTFHNDEMSPYAADSKSPDMDQWDHSDGYK